MILSKFSANLNIEDIPVGLSLHASKPLFSILSSPQRHEIGRSISASSIYMLVYKIHVAPKERVQRIKIQSPGKHWGEESNYELLGSYIMGSKMMYVLSMYV